MTDLMQAAREARAHAYCKYSRFAVGAALLCRDGTVYIGCNVENASSPLGLCAERTAFVKAISDGKTKGDFEAIAICGAPQTQAADAGAPCYPCGACRQVMAEFCDDSFRILLTDGTYTLAQLLPFRFTL